MNMYKNEMNNFTISSSWKSNKARLTFEIRCSLDIYDLMKNMIRIINLNGNYCNQLNIKKSQLANDLLKMNSYLVYMLEKTVPANVLSNANQALK